MRARAREAAPAGAGRITLPAPGARFTHTHAVDPERFVKRSPESACGWPYRISLLVSHLAATDVISEDEAWTWRLR
ncbi:hypothetical protein GCM10012275_19860 [Longimycelium tulufanense]|uniref:Uncharacterized protein n=1 Tax=Longimycelium tulufanense TaxID=907463 RepID=A0A8J3CCT8_9PSEU|nr:hypothetical protein [Longimycelium tulufanense]GGM48995.1 hypothetical protein GCM10012275_19860 [Longimycelium tulufanense]